MPELTDASTEKAAAAHRVMGGEKKPDAHESTGIALRNVHNDGYSELEKEAADAASFFFGKEKTPGKNQG
ncbi:MAG: hypothetical protein HFE86_04835 [Clostridiales bacterium]|nr:hypothetical protein [Clostridiales bacterium]